MLTVSTDSSSPSHILWSIHVIDGIDNLTGPRGTDVGPCDARRRHISGNVQAQERYARLAMLSRLTLTSLPDRVSV